MYLVCNRAWYDIQAALKVFEKNQIGQEKENAKERLTEEVFIFGEENKNLELLVEPFVKLWRKIESQFFRFGEKLTTKEDGIKNRFRLVSEFIFDRKGKKEREIFLGGFPI